MKSLMFILAMTLVVLNYSSCAEDFVEESRQNPEIQKAIDEIESFRYEVIKGRALRASTERDKDQIEALLIRAKTAMLRLEKNPKDNRALRLLNDTQRFLSEYDVPQQDLSAFQDVQQTIGKIASAHAKLIGITTDDIGYTLFSYNFSQGIYPFGTVASQVPWTTDWSLDRSYASVTGYGNTAWLISPTCDFTKVDNPRFAIRHSLNINRNTGNSGGDAFDRPRIIAQAFKAYVFTNYTGGDPNDESVKKIPLSLAPMPSSMDFHGVTSPEIGLEKYRGKNVTVALQFDMNAEELGRHYATWTVENFEFIGSSIESLNCQAQPKPLLKHSFSTDKLIPYQNLSLIDGGTSWKPFEIKGKGFKYAKIDTADRPTDSWLLSPLYDLKNAKNLSLVVQHAVNSPKWDKLHLKISDSYNGGDPELASWKEYKIVSDYDYEAGGWRDLTTPIIDISEFSGKKIVIAFRYEDAKPAYHGWEIGSIQFLGEGTVTEESYTLLTLPPGKNSTAAEAVTDESGPVEPAQEKDERP